MPILTAPGAGARNFGSRLSGACFWAKLTPWIGDVERAGRDRDRFGATAEHLHRFRQGQFAGDARFGVVVAADDEGRDPGLMQPSQLIGEKARRLHRGLIAVVEVAGDQQARRPSRRGRESTMRTNAWRVAPPISSASAGSRNASVRSGESRWMSAVWTNWNAMAASTRYVAKRATPSEARLTPRRRTKQWHKLALSQRAALGHRPPSSMDRAGLPGRDMRATFCATDGGPLSTHRPSPEPEAPTRASRLGARLWRKAVRAPLNELARTAAGRDGRARHGGRPGLGRPDDARSRSFRSRAAFPRPAPSALSSRPASTATRSIRSASIRRRPRRCTTSRTRSTRRR